MESVSPRGYLSTKKKSKKGPLKQIVLRGPLKNNYTLLWDMESNEGYIKIVAVMQKFFDRRSATGVTILRTILTMRFQCRS